MQSFTISTAILALLLQPSFGYDVPEITLENIEALAEGKHVFVKAFAPWCGHCKSMAADWEKLAEEYKDHKTALVAEIDCTKDDGGMLCETLGVEGFPTLLYGDIDDLENYDGGRDYESLSAFAKETITKPFCSLKSLDACTDDDKKSIGDLRKKSKEDLEAMVTKADSDIESINDTFMVEVEKLQEKYQELTTTQSDDLDKVKKAVNYKWLTKVFVEKGGEIKVEGMGDEL